MLPATTVKLLVAAALLSSTAAQGLFPATGPGEITSSGRLAQNPGSFDSQQPLGYSQGTTGRPPVGHFTRKQQDNTTCPTYGESQWTGTVTVGDGRGIFYWYFDSRSDPENDPVIIWMNGGPGFSSMLGLFDEMGPCWLQAGADKAEPNPWSWNNNASLLFLDQPAGAGLSPLADGLPLPVREEDTAQDFQQFLNTFFLDIFPQKKNLPIHIASESYGGHFGPVYLHHILQSRRYKSRNAFWGNITSLILVNAVIDFTGTFVGVYELLCDDREKKGILNATACEAIAQNLPEQQRLGQSCQLAYKASEECTAAHRHGDTIIHGAYKDLVKAGERHPMNIHKKCPANLNYPQCPDPTQGNITAYLNQQWVKNALDMPSSFHFQDVNRAMFDTFDESGAIFKPTTQELADVLDIHSDVNNLGDVRVMALNGNLDFLVSTAGNIWQYERLGWSGQAEYNIKKWQPLPKGLAATGSWKATSDGRLAFVAVDDAGHTVPGDVREGSYRIVQKWLEGGWRM